MLSSQYESANWQRLAQVPELEPGEAHVWRSALDSSADHAHIAWLSAEENVRASNFRSSEARSLFVNSRLLLRSLLSRYCRIPPAKLWFETSPRGKPCLKGEALSTGIRFNLSHTRGCMLVAISRDLDMGVDVESIKPEVKAQAIADRFFTAVEADELRQLDDLNKTTAFRRVWTRKEAVVKALGSGIAHGFSRFTVSTGTEPKLLAMDGEPISAGTWSLFDIEAGPSHVGAIAVRGTSDRVLHLDADALHDR